MCTANSARSHLAAALWRRVGTVPAASAGTHPAAAIDPGAIAAAGRHELPLRRLRPRHIDDVYQDGDLVVTVCDLAREELGGLAAVHWSVPDPVPAGDPGSFDAALDDLGQRVGRLALRLVPPPAPAGACQARSVILPADGTGGRARASRTDERQPGPFG